MKPTINTEKHIVQRSVTTIQENSLNQFIIAQGTDSPANADDVRVGAVVKAVWVEMWELGESSQPVTQISTIEKLDGTAPYMVYADVGSLHTYANKKNILQMSQGTIGDSNTSAVPVFRGWIPIPKGKQRFGLDDKLVINIGVVGTADNGLNVCGTFIYKEQY